MGDLAIMCQLSFRQFVRSESLLGLDRGLAARETSTGLDMIVERSVRAPARTAGFIGGSVVPKSRLPDDWSTIEVVQNFARNVGVLRRVPRSRSKGIGAAPELGFSRLFLECSFKVRQRCTASQAKRYGAGL